MDAIRILPSIGRHRFLARPTLPIPNHRTGIVADVSGEIELTPSMLQGKVCYLTVETEDYEDQEGKTKSRNVVPFAGYERGDWTRVGPPPEGTESPGDISEEDLPF